MQEVTWGTQPQRLADTQCGTAVQRGLHYHPESPPSPRQNTHQLKLQVLLALKKGPLPSSMSASVDRHVKQVLRLVLSLVAVAGAAPGVVAGGCSKCCAWCCCWWL